MVFGLYVYVRLLVEALANRRHVKIHIYYMSYVYLNSYDIYVMLHLCLTDVFRTRDEHPTVSSFNPVRRRAASPWPLWAQPY